ncbi:hypothetical protein Tco_1021965 [Tanacetum coccineum]
MYLSLRSDSVTGSQSPLYKLSHEIPHFADFFYLDTCSRSVPSLHNHSTSHSAGNQHLLLASWFDNPSPDDQSYYIYHTSEDKDPADDVSFTYCTKILVAIIVVVVVVRVIVVGVSLVVFPLSFVAFTNSYSSTLNCLLDQFTGHVDCIMKSCGI